ncbi:MAG: hypothetical protein DRP18_00655, partial [Candidatus Aenigmatarchaeota archaeon]
RAEAMPVREKPSKPVTRVRNKLFSKKSLTRKELHHTSFRSLPIKFLKATKKEMFCLGYENPVRRIFGFILRTQGWIKQHI